MRNLAGCSDSDIWAAAELARAGIEIVVGEAYGEPKTRVWGRLGAIEFRRAWRYWVAAGLVPLDVAKRLYADPVGRTDVRVDGHCACPAPEEPWICYYDGGKRVAVDPDGSEEAEYDALVAKGHLTAESKPRFVKSAEGLAAFVDTYHIDSEAGLRLFADAVRAEGGGP